MSVFLFPGQGSQSKGMGETLFSRFPDLVVKADAILGYSIEKLCLEDPLQQLNQTQYTQPALFVVNALTYFNRIAESQQKPTMVAGHSLGEYNALLAAEAFDFETGLKLVKKRGELMSQVAGGAMAAIIGLKIEAIKETLAQHYLTQIAIANINSYMQIVISGVKDDIARAQVALEQAGASLVIPLKVSGAFHSPFMQAAQVEFAHFLNGLHFAPPALPVIANVTAKSYTTTELVQTLAKQITHSVRWADTIEYALAQGETEFFEAGPGNVLTGLVRAIRSGR